MPARPHTTAGICHQAAQTSRPYSWTVLRHWENLSSQMRQRNEQVSVHRRLPLGGGVCIWCGCTVGLSRCHRCLDLRQRLSVTWPVGMCLTNILESAKCHLPVFWASESQAMSPLLRDGWCWWKLLRRVYECSGHERRSRAWAHLATTEQKVVGPP